MAEELDKDSVTADEWASAQSEQDAQESAGGGAAAEEDPWAAAIAEQAAAQSTTPRTHAPQTQPAVFRPLTPDGTGAPASNLDMILDIPVQLTVELGHTRISIKNLLQLAQGSVVELENLAGEPMDVLVNGCLIAQGEVVVVNDKFGIRLTDIISPSERIRRLNR
jgi:flagellar motor switch protein FliN